MTCPIDGTVIVSMTDLGVPTWLRADPETHISDELLRDPEARAFLEGRYVLGAWCEDMKAWHATTDQPIEKDAAICPRGHDESHTRVLPSGKLVCRPCRQLRKKRKEDRRHQKWPFVEMLPAETGYNLGHHRTKPGDEHATGEGCHCLPDRIPHRENAEEGLYRPEENL